MSRFRWGIAAALGGAVAAAAVLAVALAGGDDDADPAPTTTAPPRAAGGLRFSGGELPGTIYLTGGGDPLNADLYRVRGRLSGGARLTRNGRVSGVAASGDTVVVADARGQGSDRVERANLRAKDVLPGTVIDPAGQAPAFSTTGQLLYSVPQYGANGAEAGDRVVVTGVGGGDRPRTAVRTRSGTTYWGWGPGDRVAGFEEKSNVLMVDPGTDRTTTIPSGLDRIGDFMTARSGALAFAGPGGAVSIVAPGGSARVVRTPWVPQAWSPDSRSLLVTRGTRLGLMAADSGSVREVGSVSGGRVFEADWVADETPVGAGS